MSFISRRSVLIGLPFAAAPVAMAQPLDASETRRASTLLRTGTPQMALGPFYPVVRPHNKDADLTRLGRNSPRALGEVIDVAGVVLGEDGRTPVSKAVIDIWQAAASGAYNHPSDPNAAPRDPNFQGFARLKTDSEGQFRFRTIKPGPYDTRAPHIHFDISGKRRRLITQMLFPDEPLNASDNVLAMVRSESQRTLAIAERIEAPAGEPPLFRYLIVLGGE